MQINICPETHSTIRFVDNCPTCSEPCESGIYTLDDTFLAEDPMLIQILCPTDGSFEVSGTLAFTWTPTE
jgi:hypothetical protein